MEVEILWGIRSKNSTYTIKAKTREDAKKKLLAQPRNEWGRFDGCFQDNCTIFGSKKKIKLKKVKSRIFVDAKDNVKKVRLTPWYKITMPRWPDYRNQSTNIKRDWDAMWKALMKHEKGHLNIFIKGFNQLVKELKSLKTAKYKEVDNKISNAFAMNQKAHNKYDTKTNHGINQGVKF